MLAHVRMYACERVRACAPTCASAEYYGAARGGPVISCGPEQRCQKSRHERRQEVARGTVADGQVRQQHLLRLRVPPRTTYTARSAGAPGAHGVRMERDRLVHGRPTNRDACPACLCVPLRAPPPRPRCTHLRVTRQLRAVEDHGPNHRGGTALPHPRHAVCFHNLGQRVAHVAVPPALGSRQLPIRHHAHKGQVACRTARWGGREDGWVSE
jgi:hypothetical protein